MGRWIRLWVGWLVLDGGGVLLALLLLELTIRVWPGLFYPGAVRTPFGVEQA